MNKDRILIVDDQKFNLDILIAVLGDEYRLSVALDGKTALALARKEPPLLVLLDVDLPDMSGFEICRTLKEDPATKDVAVIFLTGLGDPESEVLGLSLGAVDFITKPFNPLLVKARVDSHLALVRTHKELLEQKEKLAQNERLASLGRLLTGLAHELNTPLGNALLANSGLASILDQRSESAGTRDSTGLGQEDTARFRSMVDMVDRSIRHASDLVEQVRQTLGDRKDSPLENFKVHKLLEYVLSRHASDFQSRNLHPALSGPDGEAFHTRATDLGDLVSLIINQGFFASRNPGQITIAHHIDTAGNLVFIYQDEGPGLSPAEIKSYFEPSFWFTTRSPSKGLATYRIYSLAVYQLGGTITVDSPRGQGMEFRLEIPPAPEQPRSRD